MARRLHERGLNLPCGAELTREEVKYVCAHLRDILMGGEGSKPITGWLDRRERFLKEQAGFPGVEFINPDFHAMDCEISLEKPEELTEGLLGRLHRELGFKRLFIRESGGGSAAIGRLESLGFVERQRIPMVRVGGCPESMELFRQPYADVQGYDVILMKAF